MRIGAILLALLLGAAFLPIADAHAAPDPLPLEVHVLADEGEDAFYWYDGYDLFNLHVRQAYWFPLDQEGLILRFDLYGGKAPESTASELSIVVKLETPTGEHSFTVSTTDDETWSGDMEVLAAEVTPDEPPFTGVTAKMQTFIPLDAIGAATGDAVMNIQMESLVDGEVVDVAPGGVYLPHSGGAAEVPHGDSERLVDELLLEGTGDYAAVSTVTAGNTVTVTVDNAFTETGQHILLKLPEDPAGWTVASDAGTQRSVDGGETATFTFTAVPGPDVADPLTVPVITDLGGRTWLHLGTTGEDLQVASTPEDATVVPPAEPEETPAPLLAALLALGLVALGRRGRR